MIDDYSKCKWVNFSSGTGSHGLSRTKSRLGSSSNSCCCSSSYWHYCFKLTIHNCFTAFWILSGTTQVSQYQKKHSPTHTYHGHQSSLICFSIYYDPWHPPCSIYVPDSLFAKPLSKSFFSSFLPLGLAPSTSYSNTFLHPVIVFFLQHMPIPSEPALFCIHNLNNVTPTETVELTSTTTTASFPRHPG